MIVVKTRMRRFPKTCKDCTISFVNAWGERFCGAYNRMCPLEKRESGNTAYCKPSWCPLMEIDMRDKEVKE